MLSVKPIRMRSGKTGDMPPVRISFSHLPSTNLEIETGKAGNIFCHVRS